MSGRSGGQGAGRDYGEAGRNPAKSGMLWSMFSSVKKIIEKSQLILFVFCLFLLVCSFVCFFFHFFFFFCFFEKYNEQFLVQRERIVTSCYLKYKHEPKCSLENVLLVHFELYTFFLSLCFLFLSFCIYANVDIWIIKELTDCVTLQHLQPPRKSKLHPS